MIGTEPHLTKARIDPNDRVADEEYFRGVKETKVMKVLGKKQTEKMMSKTRFENERTVPVGAKAA